MIHGFKPRDAAKPWRHSPAIVARTRYLAEPPEAMHIWTDLLAREGALLAILMALGSGPAAFLSDRFDASGRIALAPALGFCLGVCVTTTMLEFVPAGRSYWILIPVALVSLASAAWQTASSPNSGNRLVSVAPRDLLQVAVVCIVVAGPLTYTLHEHHSVGPAAYYFTDVDNFVAEQDGAQTASIETARAAWTRHVKTGQRFGDLTQYQWAFLAHFDANLDAAPLNANVNALLGLGATETFSSFLIVLLLMGALAAFAAVRYATQSRTWIAVLAGTLISGSMALELWFDSFQAAITGLGLVMPFVIVGSETLRSRRVVNVMLLALVGGALLSVYSLFIPMLAVTAVLVLGWRAYAIRRAKGRLRPLVKPIAVRVAALILLAVALNPVGFTRDIHYYGAILHNQVPLPRVSYHLPLEVIPGWLLQTREFWNLTSLGTGNARQLLLGALIPIVFLGFIVLGVRRHRPALALVALAGACAATAEYAYVSREACTYCAERDLLPLGPIFAVLLALGLWMVLQLPGRRMRLIGAIGVALVVVSVGQRARVELRRFSDGSYFLDSANRSVLAHLPRHARAVQLEGYGEAVNAQAEQPLVYHLADERLPGRVSISLGSNLYNGTEYLNFSAIESPGPAFHSDYDYVLTRLAGIDTDRRLIARSGGIALEERTQPLDVMTYSGIEVPFARLDSSGAAWVQPGLPLQLYVIGPSSDRAWARLTFRTQEPVSIPPPTNARMRQRGSTVIVCVPAIGSPPVRDASLQLLSPPVSGPVPSEEFPPEVPSEGIELTSMRAVTGRCAV
jgi:hypothetical protein